jgi:hypothetical protein
MPRGNLSMTRMHFEAIADTLRRLKPDRETSADLAKNRMAYARARNDWDRTIHAFADMCARSNGGFDRARFLKACGMEE